MTSVEEQFRQWCQTRGCSPPLVDLLRVEDGAVILAFPSAGSPVATVSLMPLDGSSFFADGLEDLPAEVEDWLTNVNTSMSEKSKLTLGEALNLLLDSAPPIVAGNDEPMPGSDGEDLMGDEDIEVEAAEERARQRAAYNEEQHWNSVVHSSALQGSRQASQVLMREMRALMALEGDGMAKALEIEMVEDSLYHWCVKMHASGFPEGCSLRKELTSFASQHPSNVAAVVMDVAFPDRYPMDPPFIRVVRPRFQMHTGHITIGGSVCMQLLTPSGWLPSVSLENVFVSIRSEMLEGGGRLDLAASSRDYSLSEAKEAFNRVASRYGWLAR
eukprot:CAMPEP_0171092172 /NCGR_PEP_ID=MMETSP0766_2-20121228/35538_1 /TAXON_ID=439317 /ORGANISM="Gambierdiscus australes, Strain CAWD 149" /LENGTH=328 /DNA_ID=CAMNT_0011550379 /DNA_START=56 /DNA_END=1042 /DNA_ORIENTATION=-